MPGPAPSPLPDDVRALVEALERAAGENLRAVVFFGSRMVGSSPGRHSAADLFVVVEDLRSFYDSICPALRLCRGPAVLSLFNRVLAPNVLLIRPMASAAPPATVTPAAGTVADAPAASQDSALESAGAKCFVMGTTQFERALSTRAKDHFCLGRLSQRVLLIHARDESDRDHWESVLRDAHRVNLQWLPTFLPPTFDLDDFCLRMLEVSYRSEIRPESPQRVREVFLAQREDLRAIYGPLLETEVREGQLLRAEAGYRFTKTIGTGERLRWRAHFLWSRLRATLRWTKYIVTFEGWLDYIVHKIHRRSGVRVHLSPAQRRWPLLLLWPTAVRVLWQLRRSGQGIPLAADQEPPGRSPQKSMEPPGES